MKALSIRQPWAWLIVHGTKRIENRSWRTKFRGDFLIHVSSGLRRSEYEAAVSSARAVDPSMTIPAFEDLARGGIIGRARLVDVVPPCVRCTHPWHMPGQYGFVLDDVRPLAFKAARGALFFFEPTFD